MSERSGRRSALRWGALVTAAALTFGAAPAAFAQPADPAPTTTTEPPAPTSTEPAPPSSSEPTTPSQSPSSTAPAPDTSAPPTSTSDTPPPPTTTPDAPPKPQEEVRAQEPRPDLAVSVAFDKSEYLPESDMNVTVVVRNDGDAPATNVRFGHTKLNIWVTSGSDQLGARPTIAPGQQHVMKLVTRQTYPDNDSGELYVRAGVDGVADPTPWNNAATASVRIRQDRGTASGVLFKDSNGNGRPDAGEGLTNHSVLIEGGLPNTHTSAATDASGRFSFNRLPTGKYVIRQLVSNPNRFAVKPGQSEFTVTKDQNTDLALEAVPPAAELLKASVKFDRESYAKTDPVTVNVTLTNTSSAPVTGVVAVCNPWGDDGGIDGTGPGWAPLNPDGPGISLAAGESRTLAISDVVPPTVRGNTVSVACNFGNNGRNTFGYVGASAYAKITGVVGRAKGTVVNGETGAPIGHTRIAVLDPVTRKLIGSAELFPNGQWELYDTRIGKAVFVVPGPWKPQDGQEFTAEILADQTISVPQFVVVPGPEVPDPTKFTPDIEITAKFGKDSYDIAEPMSVKVVVKNIGVGGNAYVTVKREYPQDGMEYDASQWGELIGSRGVYLEPGQSREVTLTGTASWQAANTGKTSFSASVSAYGDTNPANDKVTTATAVTFEHGDLAMSLYGDRDENGRKDAGEELADSKVIISGSQSSYWKEVTTDAAGRAVVEKLPLGSYRAYVSAKDGWIIEPGARERIYTINANAQTAVELRTVRPLSDKLHASVSFVKDVYAPGEKYELDVTLTNQTGAAIDAVKAFCSGPGNPGEIGNAGPGWGPLVWDGPGVPLADGETKTVRVSGDQPAEAPSIGYATIGCYFGPDLNFEGNPLAHDEFRVPGQRADAHGRLIYDDEHDGNFDGDGVGKAVIVLKDRFTKKITARTLSHEDGTFQFTGLPVGLYEVVVVGPWRVEFHTMIPYLRVSDSMSQFEQLVFLEPGPEVEDPGYPPAGDDGLGGGGTARPPATGGGSGDALAKTGASVLGLALAGALLIAFGFGARTASRRKVVA